MGTGWLRLVFAGVWLLLAAGVLLRGPGTRQAEVAGLLAVAFALWNLARWRQARRSVAVRSSRPPASGEYHPEFDFTTPKEPGT